MSTWFLDMPNKDEQDLHLQRLNEKNEIKSWRPRKDEGKKREASFSYFIMDGDIRKMVCQKAFVNIYAVNQKRVFWITTLLLWGEIPKDRRGTTSNSNKMLDDNSTVISNHIQSFPLKVTHYSGRQVEYVDSKLTIKKMHELFFEKHSKVVVKYDFFRSYFVKTFNYRFGCPQIYVCSKSEELTVKLKSSHLCEKAKRAAELDLAAHMRRSSLFYRILKEI